VQIALSEKVEVADEVISALVSTSAGDLRRSITYLQSASRLSSSTSPPAPITPRDIQEIAGVVPDEVMNDFASSLGVDLAEPGSSKLEKQNFDSIRQQVKSIMREGYSAAQVLSQVRFPPQNWLL
jgi:replication factor C subunit 2/4